LLSAKLFFRLDATRLRLFQVVSINPFRVGTMLARYDVVSVRRAGATVGTEASKIETADGGVFDVS